MKNKYFISMIFSTIIAFSVITGCGDKKGNTESLNSSEGVTNSISTGESSEAKDNTGFPVTMKHVYGETIVKEKPEKIVTLNWNNADSILALGLVPVGTSKMNWGPVTAKGLLPWTEEKFKELGVDHPNVFNDLDGYDYEAIAAAAPDIIVAPYSGMNEKEYERLSEIAPTVPFKDIAWKTTWREQLLEASEAVGMSKEGEKLVEETEKFIKDSVAKYPNLSGKKAALCYISASDLSKFSVYRTIDPRASYLVDMGFVFPEKV